MSIMYTKEEIIKELNEYLNDKDNICQLYNSKLVNRTGNTSGAENEFYTEVISEELLKRIVELKGEIVPIEREDYKVDSHYEVISKTNTNRVEENIAKNLLWNNIDHLGKIIDFQIPLKRKQADKAGKIDLISFNNDESTAYIIELKTENNQKETLLRAILEIHTYYCQLNKEKFINSFNEYKNNQLKPEGIKKAVLLGMGSNSSQEANDLNQRPKLRELIEELGVEIFLFEYKITKI